MLVWDIFCTAAMSKEMQKTAANVTFSAALPLQCCITAHVPWRRMQLLSLDSFYLQFSEFAKKKHKYSIQKAEKRTWYKDARLPPQWLWHLFLAGIASVPIVVGNSSKVWISAGHPTGFTLSPYLTWETKDFLYPIEHFLVGPSRLSWEFSYVGHFTGTVSSVRTIPL